eukprot:GFUD01109795.1.p1 GENE.GFUD01109795.1~~GFUD01109795.1.p1  ORF type:complete len:558 (+),score=116.80 GFUD01109795.1:48-1721(+)
MEMNSNILFGYEGLRIQVQTMIETKQTPFLSMHLDQETKRVYVMADSESIKKLRESNALIEIEQILKTSFEEGKKLNLYDQKYEAKSACTRSLHSCHDPKHRHELSWEKDPHGWHKHQNPTVIEKLPTEILQRIFGSLELSDLKSVILVSKQWNAVASKPALWKEFDLPAKCCEKDNYVKFFEGSLSSNLQNLALTDNFDFQFDDLHFESLLHLELSFLEVGNIDLSNVSDEYVAKLVNNCKECVIEQWSANDSDNSLDQKKIESIFSQMGSKTRLESFELSSYSSTHGNKFDLSFVPSNILATAFNNLESLKLQSVNLETSQWKAIFDTMSVHSKVKHLCLEFFDPETVDMNMFDSVLSNLIGLSFCGTILKYEQLRHLLESLDKSCNLKTIRLEGDLTKISTKLLTRVLSYSEIRADQLTEIFQLIIKGASNIKCLTLIEVEEGVKDVDPIVLATAVNKLESFSFSGASDLSEDQTVEMFKEMSKGTNLKYLAEHGEGLAVNRMEHIGAVDPETLARAVHNLEAVWLDFEDSNLTSPQYSAILKRFGVLGKLQII